MLCSLASAQVRLHDYKVWCNIPLETAAETYNQQKNDVAEQGGFLFLKPGEYKSDGKSKGLLIYHHVFKDEYYAFDTECQECKANGKSGRIYMHTVITCRCNTCGSEFQNISHGIGQQTNHSGNYPLIHYNCILYNGKILVSHRDLYSHYIAKIY